MAADICSDHCRPLQLSLTSIRILFRNAVLHTSSIAAHALQTQTSQSYLFKVAIPVINNKFSHKQQFLQGLHERFEAEGDELAQFDAGAARLSAQLDAHAAAGEPSVNEHMLRHRVDLSDDQALLHRYIAEHCAQPREGRKMANFHAEADAGAGKTFTANVAANTLRHAEKRVVCTAFTAKAACNYAAGVTCHAAFLLNRSDHREGTESRLISVARSGRGSLRDRLAVTAAGR